MKYHLDRANYDIAVVEMEEQIEFSRTISPICLPEGMENLDPDYFADHLVTLVGWGTSNQDDLSPSPVLQETDLKIHHQR